MKTSMKLVLWVWVPLVLLSCAHAQQESVTVPKDEKTLTIKAENFKFEPNSIQAHQGDVLTLQIENTAGGDHNFTLKSPRGATLVNKDLPAKATTPVKITLSESGTYDFYCDKPLHSTMGMKGKIEVAAP